MKKILLLLCCFPLLMAAQSGPWNAPLRIATSSDGITFGSTSIFQDSSGVPCVIKWKGDTLICAFQWFRQPQGSLSWDRVAVKFSYDNGLTWTVPSPIVVNAIPPGSQRPFDPTLVKLTGSDSIRIYFSSSAVMPMGLDSTVNTYSAISADGINYTFEPNARVDVASRPVIDPAVIYFNNMWHYSAPQGAPQDGAYHYISNDGLLWNFANNVPSDATHNWTGNFVAVDTNELRFYGAGGGIWFNSSNNGGLWNGYTATNLIGGDPAVVKTGPNSYIAIVVGPPYVTGIEENRQSSDFIRISPNPANTVLFVQTADDSYVNHKTYRIFNSLGQLLQSNYISDSGSIDVSGLETGLYFLQVQGLAQLKNFVIER